jgi:hypothetical protein
MKEIQRQALTLGWPDVLVAPSKAQLVRKVGAAQRRGELGAVGLLVCSDVGAWHVRVVRVKHARRPRRVWPYVAAGVVVVLAGAAALGWWLMVATVAAMPVILGGAVVLALSWLVFSRATGCAGIHCPGCGRH